MSIEETTIPNEEERLADENAARSTAVGSQDSASSSERRRKKRRKIFCFHCNRPETHSNPYIGSWFYSYFIGMTFGLIHLFGPFRCQCCGRNRLMLLDIFNPRYYFVKVKQR